MIRLKVTGTWVVAFQTVLAFLRGTWVERGSAKIQIGWWWCWRGQEDVVLMTFSKDQEKLELILAGRKASVLKCARRSLWGWEGGEVCVCGAERAENVWCTQTLYFFFPVSPKKLPHFPLLYSWQKGPRCFLVRPAYLPQSAFCSFRSSLRSAFSPNLFPFGI